MSAVPVPVPGTGMYSVLGITVGNCLTVTAAAEGLRAEVGNSRIVTAAAFFSPCALAPSLRWAPPQGFVWSVHFTLSIPVAQGRNRWTVGLTYRILLI